MMLRNAWRQSGRAAGAAARTGRLAVVGFSITQLYQLFRQHLLSDSYSFPQLSSACFHYLNEAVALI